MTEQKNRVRLLYVEDDLTLAQVTIRSLTRHNIDVRHCDNLDQAGIAVAEQTFDWALLDLKVGNETSLALISTIAESQPEVRTIVLTGYGSIATAVKAIKLGAHNYLTKPVSAEEILQAFSDDGNQFEFSADTDTELDGPSLKQIEWESIQKALAENDGNVSATARQLKMHRRTLQRKLQKRPQQLS